VHLNDLTPDGQAQARPDDLVLGIALVSLVAPEDVIDDSGGMPGPWSRTQTLTLPPSRLLISSTSPPPGEYLTALLNRFVTT
jgi:hypothetical protein